MLQPLGNHDRTSQEGALATRWGAREHRYGNATSGNGAPSPYCDETKTMHLLIDEYEAELAKASQRSPV